MVVLPITVGILLLSVFIYGFLYHLCRTASTQESKALDKSHIENLFTIWSFDGKMVYENIVEATEGFDSKYLIGIGSQGSVYKVELPSQVVAVKKFHSLQ